MKRSLKFLVTFATVLITASVCSLAVLADETSSEKDKGSNDYFDWELSSDGELTAFCKKDTLYVYGVLDDQIIERIRTD